MPNKLLYEYAIIRVVPRVEREEFLNVGVIVYSRDFKFLKARYIVNEERLKALCKDLDCKEIKEHLLSFERIADGDAQGGPIAKLDLASRFRWLTATRSTVVQTSKVHPGFCDDAEKMLDKLLYEMVL
ncbi:MAG: DUF3037 domain-containing protein [Flavisolibacter sp.]|nr:DUF3037 domain-containing protein [Flavisolibacter sp.]